MTLCQIKDVEILEGYLMPNHIHMLVNIPPKLSVLQFMGYLKGKSTLMIYDNHANLKYKYAIAINKLSVKENEDPFTGHLFDICASLFIQ